jgi:hypothetical protein
VGILLLALGAPVPLATVPLGFAAVLASSWFVNMLAAVQLSELIAFLLTLAWLALRRGRELAAGVALGLACTLKPFPGLIVLLFLGLRRYRVVAGAIGAFLAVAIPATARLGVHAWVEFLEQSHIADERYASNIRNGSIQGIVQRLRWPVCENAPLEAHPTWRVGVFLAFGLTLALLAVAFLVARRHRARGGSWDLPFGMISALAMVSGPYTWEHYSCVLLLPIAVAAATLWEGRRTIAPRWSIYGAVTLALVVVLLGAIVMQTKIAMWNDYLAHGEGHVPLHLYEIAGWLPPFVLFALLGALTAAPMTQATKQAAPA